MPLRNRVLRKRLDTKIQVYNVTETRAEDNSIQETEVLAATVMANADYQSRKQVERVIAGQQTSIQQVVFTVRVPRGYTISKRSTIKIVGDSDKYDVIAIDKDLGRNQFWALVTELKD